MAHALTFHAFSANAVARIVEVRARPRTLDEFVAAETESKLRGLLSSERLEPRDLRSYDVELPATVPSTPDTAGDATEETPCPTDSHPTKDPSQTA